MICQNRPSLVVRVTLSIPLIAPFFFQKYKNTSYLLTVEYLIHIWLVSQAGVTPEEYERDWKDWT